MTKSYLMRYLKLIASRRLMYVFIKKKKKKKKRYVRIRVAPLADDYVLFDETS